LFGGVVLWSVPFVFAIDIFGSSKSEESATTPPGRASQLPSLAETAKKVSPAIVNISTTQKMERRRSFRFPEPGPSPGPGPRPPLEEDPFEEFFRRFFGDRPPPGQQRSLGSGFIVSDDGYIITNSHVIGEADKITVRLSDKTEYEATVVGSDDKTDIALIKITPKGPLPTVPLGDSSALQVGDWVMAIGNPFGLEQTLTVGIVSAKGRVINAGPYDDFIQTDTSINPGNSGGPLMNLKGEVVGINSAIFSQSGGNIGIGFAIPIDMAKSIVAQLRDTGKVTRGWLGVAIQSVTPELGKSFGLNDPKGALVAEVTKDGPAEKSGLERGDIITAFNGTLIKDSHELPSLVAQTPVGSTAEVTVLRGGKEKTFSIQLGELKDQPVQAEQTEESGDDWGMTVADITSEAARRFQLEESQKGVVVTAVEPGSPAELAGIQAGDVIEEVNRQQITSIEDFTKAMAQGEEKETLLLLARRGTFSSFFALRKAG
jgi:serine protease Do